MNAKTLANVHRFGKAGKILMTILLIAAIVAALLGGVAAIYMATLPKNAVKVTVTNHTEFKINESSFPAVWGMLADGFAYSGEKDPSDMLQNGDILPQGDTEVSGALHFFHQTYSAATIRSQGDEKIVQAKADPVVYRSSDVVTLLVFVVLLAASTAAALWMLQRLFKVLAVCESPFCAEFVSKLQAFGYSLLPVTLFASVGETFAVHFLSAGKNEGVFVQWGLLITFAVTMCLVTVFRYGVQLQKESDETL